MRSELALARQQSSDMEVEALEVCCLICFLISSSLWICSPALIGSLTYSCPTIQMCKIRTTVADTQAHLSERENELQFVKKALHEVRMELESTQQRLHISKHKQELLEESQQLSAEEANKMRENLKKFREQLSLKDLEIIRLSRSLEQAQQQALDDEHILSNLKSQNLSVTSELYEVQKQLKSVSKDSDTIKDELAKVVTIQVIVSA